jgi:Protein of unknown function (DUF3501)
MKPLTAADLYSLERYHAIRNEFRAKVLEHKRHRQVALGPHATLYFEDRLTIQYQVQEMLRTERIFEAEGIADELDAYNPLIPDGMNLKATFMIEYSDVAERRVALAQLGGIEHRVYLRVDAGERVLAIADEDLERSDEEKTSAVHFLRFEFAQASIDALNAGAALRAGVDHANYMQETVIDEPVRRALIADFD